jgi:hypothetical protein
MAALHRGLQLSLTVLLDSCRTHINGVSTWRQHRRFSGWNSLVMTAAG